nr:Disease resistant protein rga-tr, putative [Solanum bulbocastanum]
MCIFGVRGSFKDFQPAPQLIHISLLCKNNLYLILNELECNNILMWTLLGPGSVLTEPQVYGRDKEKDEIVKILINNVSDAQEVSVLPIVGMGGLGKTTLAQMVFNDQTVTEHLYPKIWICVSNDFDEKRLIKAIVESIEGRPLLGEMDLAPLQKKLQELRMWSMLKKWILMFILDFPTRIRFPSLRKLDIWDFGSLKGLLKKEGEEQFPVLEEMEIKWCPMFVIPTLSSVKKLVVRGDKSDAIGFSSISNLRALTSLNINFNKEATSLPEEMFKSLANLKYLKISSFRNLKELPTSLASLNALQSLTIEHCDALESLPEEGVKGLTSLTELSVQD